MVSVGRFVVGRRARGLDSHMTAQVLMTMGGRSKSVLCCMRWFHVTPMPRRPQSCSTVHSLTQRQAWVALPLLLLKKPQRQNRGNNIPWCNQHNVCDVSAQRIAIEPRNGRVKNKNAPSPSVPGVNATNSLLTS